MKTTAKQLVKDLNKQYPNKKDFTIMIVSHGGFMGRNLPRQQFKKSVSSHKINNTAIWKLTFNYDIDNNKLIQTKKWAENEYEGGKLANYSEYNNQFDYCDFD